MIALPVPLGLPSGTFNPGVTGLFFDDNDPGVGRGIEITLFLSGSDAVSGLEARCSARAVA
jgi:hypothetical protein